MTIIRSQPQLTPEQYEKLINMLNVFESSTTIYEMARIPSHYHSQKVRILAHQVTFFFTSMGKQIWIIDIGAIDHMNGNLKQFYNHLKLKGNHIVKMPND
jgi:hypothetical protein